MSPPPQERRHDRDVAWGVTWLAYAAYYTGRKGFSVAKKPIEDDLGIQKETLAAIDTAYLTAYAAGQFASGVLGDRIGARKLVGLGMLLSAAACAAFGSASAAAVLGVLFLLNGLAQSTGWPGTTRAMAEWTTPENRGTVMAFWSTCYQVGGIVATALAARLLREGWRAAFWGPALCMAAVAGLVLLLLRPGPGAAALEGSEPRDRAADEDARREARRLVLRSPVLYSYGASYFCIKLIRYSLLFWLPYFLSKGLGYEPELAGYVSTAFEVGGTAGVIAIGVASDRIGRLSRGALAALGLVGLAAALVLYGRVAASGITANVLSLALVGACLFGPDSLLAGAAAQDAGGPHAAATAAGFVNGMGSLGAILQGWVTVRASDAFGWTGLFPLFAGLAVLGALALAPTVKRA